MRIRVAVIATLLALAGAASCGSSNVSRSLGARCTRKDQCAERCLAPAPQTPGGLCTLSCTSPGDCPDGASCADLQGGVCLFSCTTAADCAFLGDGWACASENALPSGQVSVCIGNG